MFSTLMSAYVHSVRLFLKALPYPHTTKASGCGPFGQRPLPQLRLGLSRQSERKPFPSQGWSREEGTGPFYMLTAWVAWVTRNSRERSRPPGTLPFTDLRRDWSESPFLGPEAEWATAFLLHVCRQCVAIWNSLGFIPENRPLLPKGEKK